MRLLMTLSAALLLLTGCSDSLSEATPESSASPSPATTPAESYSTEMTPDPGLVPSECQLEGSVVEKGVTSVIGEGPTAHGVVVINYNESGQSRATYAITIYLDVTRERWVDMTLSLPHNDHAWRVTDAQMRSYTYPDAPEDLWVGDHHISLEHDGTGGSFEVSFASNDNHDQAVLEVRIESLICEDIPA